MKPTAPFANPWLWAAVAAVILFAFPQIDIGLAGLFYDPERRMFHARVHPFFEWLRKDLPVALFALAAAIALLWAAAEVKKRPVLGVSRRIGAFLLLTLALGPGLLVNVVLKDNWGRPRPSTLVEYGGSNTYVRPLIPSDQCDVNCSFVSGHASLAFWLVCFAFLAPPAWRRKAFAATLTFGAAMGAARIIQGGHFLSDVLFSGIFTVGLAALLHRRIVLSGRRGCGENPPSDDTNQGKH